MDDLDHVERLLSVIRIKGWDDAFSQDVFYGVQRSSNHAHSEPPAWSDAESLMSLRRLLEDSKHCMATLAKILDRLRGKIRRLEKRAMPLVLTEGIARLPDELLANIFELGHLSVHSGEFASRGVSRVSRRFRAISLKTPILWTRLSVTFPEAQIHTFLSRSGQLDLEINTLRLTSSNLEPALKILGKYSHRWSSLTIFGQETEPVMERLGLTKFPRLNYLLHSDAIKLFALTWEVPTLSHIVCHYRQFHPGFPFPAQLATFQIRLEYLDQLDIGGFAQALQSMTNLRDLSVYLTHCRSVDNGTDWNRLNPHSVQIDKLTIRIGKGTVLEVVQGLYDALSFLTASTVEIFVHEDIKGRPAQSYYLMTEDFKFFPFGTIIKVHVPNWIHMPHLFSDIGQYCNIAHAVHLNVPLASYFSDIEDMLNCTPFPSIRHIEFHNCSSLSEQDVKIMVEHSLFAQVEDFKLVSCPNVSEDFLLDYRDEIGEKIQWTL